MSKENIKLIQRAVGANPDGTLGNETLTKFQCRYGIPSKAMVEDSNPNAPKYIVGVVYIGSGQIKSYQSIDEIYFLGY